MHVRNNVSVVQMLPPVVTVEFFSTFKILFPSLLFIFTIAISETLKQPRTRSSDLKQIRHGEQTR